MCFLYPMNQRLCPVFLVRAPTSVRCAEKPAAPFFIFVGRSRKIDRVDKADARLSTRPPAQDGLKEMLVDASQDRRTESPAKLVKLSGIGPVASIWNRREAAPVALLPKQLCQEVGGAGPREQQKQ